jgi:hypothetical protein
MRSRPLLGALLVPVLALSACGSKSKDVDTASYTCADFNKSLKTKGDDTAGNFINQLRKQAKLKGDEKTGRRAVTLGIYFACRGKPGSTAPAKVAIASAKQLQRGKFKLPAGPPGKKKSTK